MTAERGEPIGEWTARADGDADGDADGGADGGLDWRCDAVWQSVVRDYAALVRDGVIPAGAMIVPWQVTERYPAALSPIGGMG